MPYIVQARMSQFDECTNYDPQGFNTFAEALLHVQERMISIRGRMWEYVLPKYQTFMGGLGRGDYPIEEVTTIPESDELLLFFGSSHSNCESWSFEVSKTSD